MMFKNTMKLTMANFINNWKILLYKLIVFLCVLGLTITISWPIINTLIIGNYFEEVAASFEGLFFNGNVAALFQVVVSALSRLITVLAVNNQLVLAIVIFLVAIILYYFLAGIADLSISDVICGYMSNSIKYSFLNTYVANLQKSVLLQLAKVLVVLPINLFLMAVSVELYTALSATSVLLATLLTMVFIIIFFAIKNTLFSGWIPAVVVTGCGVWKGFKKGFKAMSRRFYRTFSTNIMLIVSVIVVNVFALLFTCGAGLFITLPLSHFAFLVFNMTMYYGSNAMRYYVDPQNIVSPIKLEQQDTMKKVKDII